MSVIILGYILREKPFEKKMQNTLELFNEVFFYCLVMVFFAFTDFIDDGDLKWKAGWAAIIIIMLNITINIMVIVVDRVKKISHMVSSYCSKRKAKKMPMMTTE